MIGYRNHEGAIKNFSTSSRKKSRKEPWGVVADCKFPANLKTGEICFGFTNRNNSLQAFQVCQLDPSLWKACPFTAKLMQLRSEGEEEKIAKLLSLVLHSQAFSVKPDNEKFDEGGLEKEAMARLRDEEKDEAHHFLASALASSMEVASLSEVPSLCNGSRKRSTEEEGEDKEEIKVKKKKLTNTEQVQKAKQEELADEEGIEVEVQKGVSSRREILIDELENSPHLENESPVNAVRVQNLLKSMEENFDLSQIILTVCLSDDQVEPTKGGEKKKHMKHCLHGRHRLAALKIMDQKGSLAVKKGMEDRRVICVVLESDSPSAQSYVQLRGNKIQADVKGFNPVQVIFSIYNLRLEQDKEQVAETIRRFGVQLELSSEDVNLLKKMAIWLKLYKFLVH